MTKQVHYKTNHSEEYHRIDYVRCADIDVHTRTLIVEIWDADQANSYATEICGVVDYYIT